MVYTTCISVNQCGRNQETYQSDYDKPVEMCVTIVNFIQNIPLRILVNLHLLPRFYIQISKILKTFLIDSQPEEFS